MKMISALAAVVALGTCAFAQKVPAKTTPAKAEPKTISCAVMKNDPTDIAKAVKDGRFADYKGRRYVFCCDGCKPAFQKDPAKFAATAPSIAIPKAPAKKKA